MKTFLLTFGLAVALVFVGFSGYARAQDNNNVTFQTFYDQLAGEGTWIQTDNYGYVWQPQVSDPNWQPYTNGNWVYSDQGWTWNSDEPWAWATYHYGRWVNLEGTGWCWVPGYTWAPAWVSWREGDGYAGWAPLPPDTEVGIDFWDSLFFDFGFGYHIGDDCDIAYGIGPGCYNFCPVADLGAGDYRPYYANRNDNFRLINHTRNVTNINVGARGSHEAGRLGRVTAGGPSFADVNAHSRTPVQRVNLAESSRAGSAGLRGNTLAVYAPNVDPSRTARPHSVAATLNHPGVNRGTDITRPLAVNSRVSPASPTVQQVAAARTAQAHATSGVATNGTHFRLANDRSFSTMQPIGRVKVATHQPAGVNSAAVNEGPSAFTGLGASSHVSNTRSFNGESAFTGQGPSDRMTHENVAHATTFHANSSGGSFHSAGSFFHPGGAEHHESALVHHESFAPSHSSFHASAPAMQHFSAPHFGGGGGAPHFGGGSVHASGGGGRPSGGGHPGGGGGSPGGGRKH